MKEPFLSIIIPVYNVEDYIEQCLASIYSQDINFLDLEIIIVDDGTQDKSIATVENFLNFPNIKLIAQKNSGLSVARNNGLELAKGKYVWFVDSDDWLIENSLNVLFESLKKFPEIDIFITPLKKVYPSKKISELDLFIDHNLIVKGKNYLFQRFPVGAAQRFIIKRDFLEKTKIKFYPQLLHEDALFGPQLIYNANLVLVFKNALYNYRIRESGSIMSSWRAKNSFDLIFIHKELVNFLNQSIENKIDRVKFLNLIHQVILMSFRFAGEKIDSAEFEEFYKNQRKYIKRQFLILLTKDTVAIFGFKRFLKYLLYYISPLTTFKISNKF
ncbi:glycosyltransferase [Leeuwenhoekiella palythoae]|uniref:Glycosyltransferase involved in cell wall biosynthesis n=1 Tax=Leeuwenhoekiella palythoae TaxID=573501 RepID=A0A1M5UDT8_9FLAO|nr:glycosyltransferase [Leeuwenhoekiella palythoae]RXG27154.1 glycosyltransferase involved in cell wall biosynthesis [Leeuwenhoekiella palythoae]SHH60986.1 Glycosyltransferase involved in cell wall bisynthesis [Leeuwenhoekiella palythoae]